MAAVMPRLELRCLGLPTITLDGRAAPPEVLWRKHLALLVYLALSPDQIRSRSQITGLLWGERPDDKARRSLNEAVRLLRATLGDDRLITDGDCLRLNTHELEVDALEFERLRSDGHVRALELIRGEFLEGFHVDDAPAFEEWIAAERARIRDAATTLLVARAADQLTVNRHLEAGALARRALSLNSFNEPALSLAMRSAALDGDTAGALAAYHDFTDRLQRELGEHPSAALRALADRIRGGGWQRVRSGNTGREPPLVGRREAHAQLFSRLERLGETGPCCFVVSGDAGSGRTRLLQACADRAALNGALVASARLLESDQDAPWSTLRALMRGGLLEAPGLTGMDHVGFRVLAGIVPEIAERIQALDPRDVSQVADALRSLLTAVGEQQPVLLCLDDAQWADRVTLTALRSVWSRERATPLALVVTIDVAAEQGPELLALVSSVDREIAGAQIRLEPFTTDDVVALMDLSAPWSAGVEDRERLARRIVHESGGNPFLAVTLLRDVGEGVATRKQPFAWPEPGATYDSTIPVQISAALRSAILARVSRLDADSTALLRAASIARQLPNVDVVAQVAGVAASRADAALEQLEREQFVVFDDGRYAFNGRIVPAVIESACIQPGGRRRLRERWAVVLAGNDDVESQLLRARLLADERNPEAFEAALRAAERALAAGARRTASSALRIAVRSANANPEKLSRLDRLRERFSSWDGTGEDAVAQ